ncbi:outer membrane beta-barrel protein [Aureispira sp. CCB-QB1]|uniref:outer membrane beta-barrel protein n=1 Tax=Aureispira sp. CCB-QB1 TaxID=1313421 RepID=UPI0006967D13|nr:outer membrane beta-barrel protein [Aureispira sp. CCB-QB1]
MKLSIIIILLLGSFVHNLSAQTKEEEGRFTASIVAGVNFSQIDGDEDAAYSKVGFNGGARGGVRFGDRMELCTEILFSQKGSYVKGIDKMYHLDYIEVPVLFYYKDWEALAKNNRKFMRIMVGGGFSYSRLVNATIRQYGNKLEEGQPGYANFLANDLMFMLDANIFFTRNLGLNVRWSRSILTIVEKPIRQNISYAINRSIIVRLLFKF